MGYYTDYTLTTDQEQRTEEFAEAINIISDYDFGADLSLEECCKWYDHEKEMKTLSKKFKDTLFTLEGIGEEQPDMWIKYFKNGKMQHCKAILTYPEFNESLMK